MVIAVTGDFMAPAGDFLNELRISFGDPAEAEEGGFDAGCRVTGRGVKGRAFGNFEF
jgi:hypothetical protein